jgi:hypothetical protein
MLAETRAENVEGPHSVALKLTGHKMEAVYRCYAIVSEADLGKRLKKLADLDASLRGKFELSCSSATISGQKHHITRKNMAVEQSAANPSLPVIRENGEKYRENLGCQGVLWRSDRRECLSHASFYVLIASHPSLRPGN